MATYEAVVTFSVPAVTATAVGRGRPLVLPRFVPAVPTTIVGLVMVITAYRRPARPGAALIAEAAG